MNVGLKSLSVSSDDQRSDATLPSKKWISLSGPFFGDQYMNRALLPGQMNSQGASSECVEAFELSLQKETGFKFAVATSSGTAALHLAARIVGVRPGDEVWCPTLTFIASIAPAVALGATPRFMDVDPLSWTLCVSTLEEQLRRAARRGGLPKALITADLYGNPVDISCIQKICGEYGVPVISDSAASLGSIVCNEHAGSHSLIAVISFNLNKIISTSGGGVLLTNDETIAVRARKLRAQAREPSIYYEHRSIGYNYMMSPIAASIGLAQLKTLDWRVTRRRKIFERYLERLGSIPGINFQAEVVGARSNRWLTAISFTCDLRGLDIVQMCDELWSHGIEVRPLWRPLHLQKAFSGSRVSRARVAESLADRGLCLPSSTQMTECEQEYVIEKLVAILERIQ